MSIRKQRFCQFKVLLWYVPCLPRTLAESSCPDGFGYKPKQYVVQTWIRIPLNLIMYMYMYNDIDLTKSKKIPTDQITVANTTSF